MWVLTFSQHWSFKLFLIILVGFSYGASYEKWTNSKYIDPEQGEVDIIEDNGGWWSAFAFGELIQRLHFN